MRRSKSSIEGCCAWAALASVMASAALNVPVRSMMRLLPVPLHIFVARMKCFNRNGRKVAGGMRNRFHAGVAIASQPRATQNPVVASLRREACCGRLTGLLLKPSTALQVARQIDLCKTQGAND